MEKQGQALRLPTGIMSSELYYGLLSVAMLVVYWVWDETNYQKNQFKQRERGDEVNRCLFPTFRCGGCAQSNSVPAVVCFNSMCRSIPANARVLRCSAGVLLADGWCDFSYSV